METATKVGRYEVVDELGRGGMGVVYRANDPIIGRIVALKTIRLSEKDSGISHEELVERFQTEARAAGRLAHPNIVVVYDAGEDHGLYYITMELIDGKSLQSLMDKGQKLTVQRTVNIMEQICSALGFAHNRGVVHRDIKPANIMLTRDDAVKITDFGTAKLLQYGTAQKTNAIGTPSYMSPEQIKSKAVDGRSDIFSLGVMLYEMTTGQRPFRGQDVASVLYKVLNEEPIPPHRLEPSIPAGVSSTIMKALSKSPHLRYESCAELLDDLKNYRPGEVTPKPKAASEGASAVPPPAPRESKALKPETPKIPGLDPRPATPKSTPQPPAKTPARPAENEAAKFAADVAHISGLYQGPVKQKSESGKKLVRWGIAALVFLVLGNFAIKAILPSLRSTSGRMETASAGAPSADDPDPAASQQIPYATRSNPQIATFAELATPWSSKKFFYRSLSASRNVPGLIVRLPGAATSRNSYWAFSLEAPFTNCKVEYVSDVDRLGNEYGVFTQHPMIVNPCSRSVFDPLQMKELPGHVLVRGAIIQGYDSRPPYGIEVSISGNRILATAME
jgi:serine/threonine protein kinase